MKLYITKFANYQPSPENPAEQPKLEYVDPLFKRRLSQITRMTIEVIHSLIENDGENANLKLVFASFRGEIARQFKINKSLIEDGEVMPAQFSISVFNTPPAAATIALKMKAGYTAIYPSDDNFLSALISAASTVLGSQEKNVIFAYADEKIPDEYKNVKNYADDLPLAFACVLSSEKYDGAIELNLDDETIKKITSTPQNFLNFLEKSKYDKA